MISSILNTAVSGLKAAENRLYTSANNVANMHSTTSSVNGERVDEAYRAQRVVQTSTEPGVRSDRVDVDPATIPVYDPTNVAADENGITEYPNVDLAQEVINQQIATYDFKANLKSIQAADEMAEELLDITA